MIFAMPRRPPEMGWSVTGLVAAPFNFTKSVVGDVAGTVGSIVGDVAGIGAQAVGGAARIVTPALGVVGAAGGAIQNLRPAAAGVVTPPSSNLPIYIGAGAAGLVLLLLLMKPRAPAPAPQVYGP